ncbi:MAG: (2Fe-2S)-binding protein [Gammaproteobacteria bacterium SG8_15]|nr:MAG: (2Fe-2S)-binding protein [Gammaproteobacteria bacterium SG8_15]
MKINLTVNGKPVTVDVDGDTPLLWLLRDWLQLNGTKYSCGEGICGACMVDIDGESAVACQVPVSSLAGKSVTTIEGLVKNPSHPVIDAFISEQVTQCGYCQPGMVIMATSLLRKNPNPSDQDIDQALVNNLCRCGTYQRIRQAIHVAAKTIATKKLTSNDF